VQVYAYGPYIKLIGFERHCKFAIAS